MNIAEFSVRHSMFVNLLSAFLIIAGILSLFHLKREAFPDVSFDVVTVDTYFPGASAEKVERLVTTPLERELKEVDNIEEIISSSNDGISLIYLRIFQDVKNKDKVVSDIQKAVDRVTNLPDEIDEKPVVREITSGQVPVIKVALSGDISEFELRHYTDELKDLLENIEGVASVKRVGWRDEEFWVEPDIDKMLRLHISFSELANALRAQNVELPSGRLKTGEKEFSVKVKAELRTKEDIENTVIRANDLGHSIRVKDVATVRHTFEDDIVLNKVFSTRAITLVVIKKKSGDILKIVKEVKKIVENFKKNTPSALKITTFYDFSYYVRRRLGVLKSNGFIGLLLVIGVLFIFLHPIPAIMTSLGIPVAILTTLWVIDVLGLSINLITMFGIIMVLGMIVDDGIIISENVYRYIEQGYSPKDAAIKGTKEVMLPVLATILTTISAYLPLMFMEGLIGRFVKYIPMVAIIALLASLLEAFIILPSHLADFAHPLGEGGRGKSEKRWFKYIVEKYNRLIEVSLRNRYKVFLGVFILFVSSLVVARFFMPFILFSAKGVEQFTVRLEAKPDTSLEETNRLIEKVEDLIASMSGRYLDTYETIVGKWEEERGYDPNAKQGSNLAQINVYLTPADKRDKTAKKIIEDMKPALKEIFAELKPRGVEKLYFTEFREGPPVGRPIDVRIRGNKLSRLRKIVEEIKAYLKTLNGVTGVDDSLEIGNKQINVIIDEDKASRMYLTNSDIAFAVRCAFGGGVATTVKRSKAEKEIKVLVRLPEEQRGNLDVFNKILVRNRFDNLIPLREVARIGYTQTLRSIKHLDGKRFISVTADVDNVNITSGEANNLIRERFKDLGLKYPGYTLHFSGENKETKESLLSLFKAFGIAILVMFLILATLFNSLIQPFIVMSTIPFALIGVIFAFLIHREPLSFLVILGLVGLCGVVVNDSIVLVDFINKLRSTNPKRPTYEVIKEAGQLRLRPVLLTTITTIAGLATVAYGIGGKDPFLQPMALAIFWGLLLSTFLTLIVVPCTYLIIEDIKGLLKRNYLI